MCWPVGPLELPGQWPAGWLPGGSSGAMRSKESPIKKRAAPESQPLSLVIVIVIMVSVAINSAIRYADNLRTFDTERKHGFPGNPDRPASHLDALDGSKDVADHAVVSLRFYSIRIRPNCVALAVHPNGFQVENQVVIAGDSYDKLYI